MSFNNFIAFLYLCAKTLNDVHFEMEGAINREGMEKGKGLVIWIMNWEGEIRAL